MAPYYRTSIATVVAEGEDGKQSRRTSCIPRGFNCLDLAHRDTLHHKLGIEVLLMFRTILLSSLVAISLIALPRTAGASEPVSWSSAEGIARLAHSEHKVDFFQLANHYQAQPDQMLCGPTSAIIVMNALRWSSEKAPLIPLPSELMKFLPPKYEARIRGYTLETFFTPEVESAGKKKRAEVYGKPPKEGKPDYGIPLESLSKMIRANGFRVEAQHVDNSIRGESVVKALIENLGTAGNYVIVNFDRKALGQKGGGHFSPIGAYDEITQSFLIMDVNPTRAPWVWVSAKDIVNAMDTADGAEHRGYLQISDLPEPVK